jgi:hypothetical protein
MLYRLAVLALLLCTPLLVLAGTINPDGTWYEFSFVGTGVLARGCFPADPAPEALDCIPSSSGNSVPLDAPPWTFTALTPVFLTVTDAFLYGDAFRVFDCSGLSLLDCVNPAINPPITDRLVLTTSPPVSSALGGCGDDPAVCLLDPLASHGMMVLPISPSGSYSLAIVPYAVDFAGAAYLQVAPVPEPPAGLLIAAGLIGLTCVAHRRRASDNERKR